MKPSAIFSVLDLAFRARALGEIFNPLFVGAPGLGKSQIVQAYAKSKGIPFIDIRAAYYEAPDMVGFPTVTTVNGRQVTTHNIPEMWPHEGTGIILLEEPNRGTTSVMNTMMQMLTDRRISKYDIPPGWVIVGCINPENEQNDVNVMDPALKDRFEIFEVDYNRQDFLAFMRDREWDASVINFVETNVWSYVKPEEVTSNDGAKYISPRTFSKLNAALKAGIPADSPELERVIYNSILGRITGNAFFTFKHNDQPVMFKDLENPKKFKAAIAKLKAFSDPKDYKAGTISVTIRDIVEDGTIEDELLSKVILALPADQGPQLISELSFKRKDKTNDLLKRLMAAYPEVQQYLKSVLKQQ
jgi:hypothetical protein